MICDESITWADGVPCPWVGVILPLGIVMAILLGIGIGYMLWNVASSIHGFFKRKVAARREKRAIIGQFKDIKWSKDGATGRIVSDKPLSQAIRDELGIRSPSREWIDACKEAALRSEMIEVVIGTDHKHNYALIRASRIKYKFVCQDCWNIKEIFKSYFWDGTESFEQLYEEATRAMKAYSESDWKEFASDVNRKGYTIHGPRP